MLSLRGDSVSGFATDDTKFCCLLAKFLLFKLVKAGDIAPLGGSLGGRTLAVVFFGIKFWAVFVIA